MQTIIVDVIKFLPVPVATFLLSFLLIFSLFPKLFSRWVLLWYLKAYSSQIRLHISKNARVCDRPGSICSHEKIINGRINSEYDHLCSDKVNSYVFKQAVQFNRKPSVRKLPVFIRVNIGMKIEESGKKYSGDVIRTIEQVTRLSDEDQLNWISDILYKKKLILFVVEYQSHSKAMPMLGVGSPRDVIGRWDPGYDCLLISL